MREGKRIPIYGGGIFPDITIIAGLTGNLHMGRLLCIGKGTNSDRLARPAIVFSWKYDLTAPAVGYGELIFFAAELIEMGSDSDSVKSAEVDET